MDFYAFFMIAAVEGEAWEAQNIFNSIDFYDLFMIFPVEWRAWEAFEVTSAVTFLGTSCACQWGRRNKMHTK